MNTLKTLLQREWFQHRTGWIVIALVPLTIGLFVLGMTQLHLNVDGNEATLTIEEAPPVALALAAIAGAGAAGFFVAWLVSLFQVPGLARRDQQDRSIEFWLSMPVGHAVSLAAPMLAHLLLFPLAAMGIGVASGLALSVLLLAKTAGLAAWFGLPWLSLLGLTLALMLRVGYGLLLATLWLSPLILLAMAASAWLKRWGLPALVAGVIVVGKLLETFFGTPVVWVTGRMLLERAGRGLLTGEKPGGVAVNGNEDPTAMLAQAPGWLWDDALGATADLAHPLLLLALAVSAGCFALLVLRRRQGA